MKRATIAAAAIALAMTGFGPAAGAYAEGDPAKGKRVYRKCQACHSVAPGEAKAAGPNLFGIIGRQAGTGGYGYSDSLIEAGEAGLNWSEETVDAYLRDAKSFVADWLGVDRRKVRDKMNFRLRSEAQRADVIAYLISLSK